MKTLLLLFIAALAWGQSVFPPPPPFTDDGTNISLPAGRNLSIGTRVPAGTYSGTVIGAPSFAAGKFSNGVSGTSGTAHITVPTATFSQFGATDSWTLEAWLKTTKTDLRVAVGTQTNPLWIGMDATTRKFTAGVFGFSGGIGKVATDTPAINDGAWHHCALVLTAGTTITLWVDGVLGGTYSGVYVPTSGNAAIGDFPAVGGSDYDWNTGSIDEVAVWTGARYASPFTPPTAPYAGTETGLRALYHLDSDGSDSAGAGLPRTTISPITGITDTHLAPSLRASFTNAGSALSASSVCTTAISEGTISSIKLMSDGTLGNATVDFQSQTWTQFLAGTAAASMTGGNPATFTAARGVSVSTFTGWTNTAIRAGMVYCFALTAPASIVGLSVVVSY